MAAMLVAGRIIGRVDLRLVAVGAASSITAFALWQMTGYSLDYRESDIIWPGVIQGIGLGFVFVPLSAATFATLSPEMRAQGTAIFSLVRNIGSSIGISMVQTLLVRGTVERPCSAGRAHHPCESGVDQSRGRLGLRSRPHRAAPRPSTA